MKFSIVIPVYNVEKYLMQCVESILSQDMQDYEIILIDDGSTDSSSDICDKLKEDYHNIFVVHQENQGLSAARNNGVRFCHGEYIIFLDSDDVFLSDDCLRKIGQSALNCDIVLYDMREFADGREGYYDLLITERLKNRYETGIDFLEEALFHMIDYRWYAWIYAYRRQYWIENHFTYPIGYKYEDIGTTYRVLLAAKRVNVLKMPVYGYRRGRMGAITKNVDKKALIDKINLTCGAILDIQSMKNLPATLVDRLNINMSCSYYEVLIRSALLDKKERKDLFVVMKDKVWIARYAAQCILKYKIVYFLIVRFGLRITGGILGLRRKLRLTIK